MSNPAVAKPPVILVARTLAEARRVRRERAADIPDLRGAILGSTCGGRPILRWGRMRAYVTPSAQAGPYYSYWIIQLRYYLSKKRVDGADPDVIFLPLPGPGHEPA